MGAPFRAHDTGIVQCTLCRSFVDRMVRTLLLCCFLLLAAADSDLPYKVYAAALTELGNSGVAAEVTVFAAGDDIMGVGTAAGLEPRLDRTRNCTAINACGLHVHAGSSCANSATQGGHHFTGTSDPWAGVMYPSTDGSGAAAFEFYASGVPTDIAGRTFIVHNSAGGRVACGVLEPVTANVSYAVLESLAGSGATGAVTLHSAPGRLRGAGTGAGLETGLSEALNCTATNGCGVHVHSGTGCANGTAQGGHYYTASPTDPWLTVRYPATDAKGAAMFAFSVPDGFPRPLLDRPFILHNNAGGRVACGMLRESGAAEQSPSPSSSSAVTASVLRLLLGALTISIVALSVF